MCAASAIVCFGEIVWDMLPTGKQAGGAPFHVAAYLRQLGLAAQLISRVGDDELGVGLLAALGQHGLEPSLVQRSATHLTGVVKALVHPKQDNTYKILGPVAWDYIQHSEALRAAVAESQAFVYGTLAARRATTRETLYRLLQVAPFKVLNVNLRPPHCSREVVKYLLRQADIVKLNQRELIEITLWLGLPATEDLALPALAERFGLQAVCLTKGAAGATLWTNSQLYITPGEPASKAHWPGSSNAFVAAFLAGWLAGQPPDTCLRQAYAATTVAANGDALRCLASMAPR